MRPHAAFKQLRRRPAFRPPGIVLFFSLEYAAELRIIVLRRRVYKLQQRGAWELTQTIMGTSGANEREVQMPKWASDYTDYSRLKQPRRVAPASIQSLMSTLIRS